MPAAPTLSVHTARCVPCKYGVPLTAVINPLHGLGEQCLNVWCLASTSSVHLRGTVLRHRENYCHVTFQFKHSLSQIISEILMVFLDDRNTGNQCLAKEGLFFLAQLLEQQEDSCGGKCTKF